VSEAPQSRTRILVNFFEHLGIANRTTTAINQMWQSRSRRIVTRSVTYIFEILTKCIEAGETQTRSFRFAVNRVAQIVESGLFDVTPSLPRSSIPSRRHSRTMP